MTDFAKNVETILMVSSCLRSPAFQYASETICVTVVMDFIQQIKKDGAELGPN